MKYLAAVNPNGTSISATKSQNRRVSRPPQHRGSAENDEMRMYLLKLKDLVPFMPKNRKLSKLEIIQHAIDYICELQTELQSHPNIDSYDGARRLIGSTTNQDFELNADGNHTADNREEADDDNDEYNTANGSCNTNAIDTFSRAERLAPDFEEYQKQHSPAARQPLVDRNSPNMFIPVATVMHQPQRTSSVITSSTASSEIQQSTLIGGTSINNRSRRNC